MNYKLSDEQKLKKTSFITVLTEINKYIGGYGKKVIGFTIIGFILVIINSAVSIVAPNIIGDATQNAIANMDKDALLTVVLGLLALYVVSSLASYFQILVMGWVGQDILARLRTKIFDKVQALPLAFFNQNKSGDLISRINSDTDKLNQAFSETLLRFIGSFFVIIGIGAAMLVINPLLGVFALGVCLILILVTNTVSNSLRSINRKALQATGSLSGEIQESLSNFKVIVAFNRRDYFRNEFNEANTNSKKANTISGIANNILTPIYDFGGNFAMFLVYFVGINLILHGTFVFLGFSLQGTLEFGTLISYVLYVDRFYGPLRQMAGLFSSIQTSLAAWSRISEILSLNSDLQVVADETVDESAGLVEFKNVSFGYDPERMILKKVNMHIEKGKTYALVGPTGGGKSTTASLIARLFDPVEGVIKYAGKNLQSYTREQIADRIGFILQEPFLFSGTIKDNIVYGNAKYQNMSDEEVEKLIKEKGLSGLLERFPKGITTEVSDSGNGLSLGQKQLIAFLRVLLREPELLILDEATANIDTVTENLLQEILDKLTNKTTRIIIAHRLNTIEQADEIFFIAGGEVSDPVNYKQALQLIEETKKSS